MRSEGTETLAGERAPMAWIGAVAGDHTAWLAGVARGEGLRPDEALDAVQEAFARLLASPGAEIAARAPGEVRAVLAAVVRNTARNMRRRHHRSRPHVELEDAGESPDATLPVDALIALAEERTRMVACVRTLEEVERQVVGLRVLEELSGQEVAQRLGLTPGHVAVLLHRAKADLVRCIAGERRPHEPTRPDP